MYIFVGFVYTQSCDLYRYCECFASGSYCNGCNCLNCHNNLENDGSRQEAITVTLERNPDAFKPKIAASPNGMKDLQVCDLKSCNFMHLEGVQYDIGLE